MSKIEFVGKYALIEKLASGGMAEVFLARARTANGLNKFVAVKKVLPHLSNDNDFISLFKDEARMALNLNHPNLVSISDFGYEDNQYFLVMDYIAGRTLKQVCNDLKKKDFRLSTAQAIYLIKEVAAGMSFAHLCTDSSTGKSFNIVHRDLTPQNIMISFDGHIKVIDFGVAKADHKNTLTEAGVLIGKFGYMSPEQVAGEPLDQRTDIFAMGIILWELLTNAQLFTGKNEYEILRNIKACQIPPLRNHMSSVSPELERIVKKCLSKDVSTRYQTAAGLQKDLSIFLNSNYPEFSEQDFSSFIQDIYREAKNSDREKLISYSGVMLPSATPEALLPNNMTPTRPPVSRDSEELPDGFDMSVAPAKTGISFSNAVLPAELSKEAPKSHAARIRQEMEAEEFEKSAKKRLAQAAAQAEPALPAKAANGRMAYTAAFLSALVIVIGAAFFFKKSAKKIGPVSVQVSDNAEVRRNVASVAQAMNSKLKISYVNIRLADNQSDSEVKVFVNGKQILGNLPLLMLPVNAEKENVITAVNSRAKTKSEPVTLKLKENETTDVTLWLNR